jgi:hypothetical protein
MAGVLRAGAGGSARLVALLREHGEAIAWDIPHYWPGRSARELFTGEMTLAELRMFLAELPADSATARSLCPRDAKEEFWTPDRQLMASLIDSVRLGNFFQVKLHGDPKKTKRLKPPDPIPRPGVESRRKVIRFGGKHGSGAAQLATVFGGAKAS